MANQAAAANIVDDPVLFVRSALSDAGIEDFEDVNGFPVLKNCLGWIIFDCSCKKGENISVVDMSPVKGRIHRRVIKPVNRGFNAVIEASIHASRYVVMRKKKHIRQIEYCNIIVMKCGGNRDKEAMRLLYELIGYSELHGRA